MNDYKFVIGVPGQGRKHVTIKASTMMEAEDKAYASLQGDEYLISVTKEY